jgi:tetratricopeptide (TPR) repeat protein
MSDTVTSGQTVEDYKRLGAQFFASDPKKSLLFYTRVVAKDAKSIEGWSQLGRLLLNFNKFEDARSAFNRVLALVDGNELPEWSAATYCNIGLLSMRIGDLEEAEKMFWLGKDEFEKLGDFAGLEAVYSDLANLYHLKGDSELAGKMQRSALVLSENVNEISDDFEYYEDDEDDTDSNWSIFVYAAVVFTAIMGLGSVYFIFGSSGLSVKENRPAAAVVTEVAQKKETAEDYIRRGELYITSDQLKAVEAYRKAIGIEPGNLKAWDMLGQLYMAANSLEEAQKAYQKISDLAEKADNKVMQANAIGRLADISRSGNDWLSAEQYYSRALAINEQADNLAGLAGNYAGLAFVAQHRGDMALSCSHMFKARALFSQAEHYLSVAKIESWFGSVDCPDAP